ncbi:MAG: hypothetical protein AB3X41_07200 [Leptothrix ochracea]|jgi:hypothetical protein|uniref:hypothetical protein n=1 Tax=Leptothrix ochracea TaxID=735331 RepID=UPI0034E2CEC0
MEELVELIAVFGALMASWRFLLCALPTSGAVWAVVNYVEAEEMQWLIGLPIALIGLGIGLFWEWRGK